MALLVGAFAWVGVGHLGGAFGSAIGTAAEGRGAPRAEGEAPAVARDSRTPGPAAQAGLARSASEYALRVMLRAQAAHEAPLAPATAHARFADFAVALRAMEGPLGDTRRAEAEALDALRAQDPLRFLLRTRAPFVATERGFAVPLSSLTRTLERWRNVEGWDARSTVVRELMEGNLAFLENYLPRLIRYYENAEHVWPLGPQDAAHLADALDRARALEAELRDVARGTTLTKRRAWALMESLFDVDRMLGGERAPLAGRYELSSGLRGAHFPLVSETRKYWPYEDVDQWARTGVFPLEVSLSDKPFDGSLGSIWAYAEHDAKHIDGLERSGMVPFLRYPDAFGDEHPARGALTEFFRERLDALERQSPALALEVRRTLNYLKWEDHSAVEHLLLGDTFGTAAGKGRIAAWLDVFDRRTEGGVLSPRDRAALDAMLDER